MKEPLSIQETTPPVADGQQTNSLGSRMRRAYFWTIAGSSIRYLAGFVVSIVLARLLKPEDYGLIGMIVVFIEFLIVFTDSGLGNAVMHFGDEGPGIVRKTYFTAALALGVGSTVLLWAAAPQIAGFYHEPRLVLLLRVMSFIMIPGSVKTVSGSILARELRFRALSIADISSSLAGGVVAVYMAYRGFGVWSLVVNLFLFVLLQALAYGYGAPPRFAVILDKQTLDRVIHYGAPTVGSSLVSKFYDNADYLVVGRLLGPATLGFYTLAFRLAMLINDRISAVINRVAFPAFANLKDKPGDAITHWFAITRRVTLVTFPLLVWLGFNAEDFVNVALGPQWRPAVLPLQFLCGMTAMKILTNVVIQMMGALGHPTFVFRYDILTAIILPTAFYLGCKQSGLVGLGIVWCTIFPLLRLFFLLEARRILPFSLSLYVKNLWQPAWLSAACFLIMLPAEWMLRSGWLRLTLTTLSWSLAMLCSAAQNPDLRALIEGTFRRSNKSI